MECRSVDRKSGKVIKMGVCDEVRRDDVANDVCCIGSRRSVR